MMDLTKKLTLDDFYKQIKQVRKMGGFKLLLGMSSAGTPEFDEDEFKRLEAIVEAMTPEERKVPELLLNYTERMIRVTSASGATVEEVQNLIRQFEEANKMIRDLKGGPTRDDENDSGGSAPVPSPKKPQGPTQSESAEAEPDETEE